MVFEDLESGLSELREARNTLQQIKRHYDEVNDKDAKLSLALRGKNVSFNLTYRLKQALLADLNDGITAAKQAVLSAERKMQTAMGMDVSPQSRECFVSIPVRWRFEGSAQDLSRVSVRMVHPLLRQQDLPVVAYTSSEIFVALPLVCALTDDEKRQLIGTCQYSVNDELRVIERHNDPCQDPFASIPNHAQLFGKNR